MQQQSAFKITGYLLAPHEWVRIWAYKLLGKGYRYQLGDHRVVSAEVLTVREQLFCLLLPLVVGLGAVLVVVALWVFSFNWVQFPLRLPDYLWQAPLWHHLLHLTWLGVLAYTLLFSCFDVLFAYGLLRKQWHRQ